MGTMEVGWMLPETTMYFQLALASVPLKLIMYRATDYSSGNQAISK